MGVLDGQQVSAAVTNPAFLDANQDDTALGKISFNNASDPGVSGPMVTNIQREANSWNSFTGRTAGSAYDALPAWINNDVGTPTDNLFQRADALTEKFNATTGHKHSGAAGDAPPVESADIANAPLRGYVLQGADLLAVSGGSTDVSTELAGKSPSANSGDVGVVVTTSFNKVLLRQASGPDANDVFTDGSGNEVYGRLTESAGVWTLAYYVDLAGTETPYSFASPEDVRWYYQELFNPLDTLNPPPVYSEFAVIPSDNATADVVNATTALYGKTLLASAAAADVGSAGSAGTANATVANANHVHRGVFSFSKFGDTALFGAVTIQGGSNVTLTQTGQNITIDASGGFTSIVPPTFYIGDPGTPIFESSTGDSNLAVGGNDSDDHQIVVKNANAEIYLYLEDAGLWPAATATLGTATNTPIFLQINGGFAPLMIDLFGTVHLGVPVDHLGAYITNAAFQHDPTKPAAVVIAAASQSADIFKVKKSDFSDVFRIGSAGAEASFAGFLGVGGTAGTSTALDVISTTGAFRPPRMTTTQKNALTAAEGMIVYDTTLGKLQRYQSGAWGDFGSGSGSSLNYIGNPDFETDTSGWATYADAAGTSPVDGTGGSPNVTITRSTTNPLRGLASALLTKDAANRQGQGWSYAFTIDRASLAKVLQISFDYLVNSGTFVAGSPSANSDVTVWLYDVTNGVLIQPSNIKLFSNNGSIPDRFDASFQTDGTSLSYRLILHVGSTSASAYELKVDNFLVTPSEYIFGTPITDWTPVTMTATWTTNTTVTAFRRRIGDEHEYMVDLSLAGAPTAASLFLNMPTGDVIDTAKIPQTITGFEPLVGFAKAVDNGTASYPGTVSVFSSSQVRLAVINASATIGTDSTISQTSPFTFGSGDKVWAYFRVPIVGKSSSVQTSDNADTRVVAARYRQGSSQNFSSGSTDIFNYSSKDFDTHGAVTTGASWKFTAPVYGYYRVSCANLWGNATWTAGSTWIAELYKNNVLYARLYDQENETSIQARRQSQGSTTVELNAGDFIDVRLQHTSTGTEATNNDSTQNYIDIERITGPSAIAASEKVLLQYTGNGGTALTANTTNIDFSTKVVDSHGAWSGTIFTAPRPGMYDISGVVNLTAAVSANHFAYINGVQKYLLTVGNLSSSDKPITGKVFLNAGDQLSIRSDSNVTLSNSATLHWIAITSHGGV